VNFLLRTKAEVVQKIEKNVEQTQKSVKLLEEEKNTRLAVLKIFSQELEASENSIFSSFDALRSALEGNFRSLENLKQSSTRRLEALKAAAVQEEERFNAILEAEKQEADLQNNKLKNEQLDQSNVVGKMLDEILDEVAEAADKLEMHLQDNMFESVAKSKDVMLETVVKIPEHTVQKGNETVHQHHEGEDDDVIRLVDSQSNQYTLTKAKDSTIPHEDHFLIHDLIYLLSMCCTLGIVCAKLGIPTMFGYVLSGVLFGPSGIGAITVSRLNQLMTVLRVVNLLLIQTVVQVETIGEFGVYFILFVVGLEFSPDRLKKVLHVSVVGSIAITVLMVCTGLVAGYLVGIQYQQSSFVAACLSLSSTPLVVKFMQQSRGQTELTKNHEISEVGSTLLGVLVMQDIQLAVIIAILPALATDLEINPNAHSASPETESNALLVSLFALLSVAGLGVASLIVSKLLTILVKGKVIGLSSRETSLLFALLSCLLALLVRIVFTDCMKL
jgi:predicted Kef-type K+ transport protein